MGLEFKIICVGVQSKIKVKNETNLLHLLLSNGDLWKDPELKKSTIEEKDHSIFCTVQNLSTKTEKEEDLQASFLISFRGEYEAIEPIRIKILEFISAQSFSYNYVIKDDVSKQIACELFPLINELETLLRGYLIRFFITKLGVRWWDMTADNEMKQKATKRKNNEKTFSQYIDNKVYLIDFNELGKMVYSLSSGYINKDDILQKLINVEEKVEAIRELKNEVQSNYNKYFKESFQDKQFQKKWEEMEMLRHKVAHNNLFTIDDLSRGKTNYNELKSVIEQADKAMDKVNFTYEEKEKIAEESLMSYNELFGDFISAWRILEGHIHTAAIKHKLTNDEKGLLPFSVVLIKLRDSKVIGQDMFDQIRFLWNFRNTLVHGPIGDFSASEKDLPNMIKNTLRAIDSLEG